MTLGYRSVLELRSPNNQSIAQIASEQFFTWMRTKRLHPELVGDGETPVGPGAFATRLLRTGEDGAQMVRLSLREESRQVTWSTVLTAGTMSDGRQWFWTDVDITDPSHEESVEPRWTATPRLVRTLLNSVEAWDGVVPIKERSSISTIGHMAELLGQLVNPTRRLPILLAPVPDGVNLGRWQSFVDQFTRETAGLAATFVLDAESREWLNARLGADYAVGQGTIRTYLSHLDISNASEARRHRFLSSSRLVHGIQDPREIVRAVGWAIRRGTFEDALPDYARTARKLFDSGDVLAPRGSRRETQAVLLPPESEATEGTPAGAVLVVADEASTNLALIANAAFGASEVNESVVTRLLNFVSEASDAIALEREALIVIERLQEANDELQARLGDEIKRGEDRELELAEKQDESIRDQAQVRRLQKLLLNTTAQDEIWLEADSYLPSSPSDMSELVAWIDSQCELVEFTGEVRYAVALEEHDSLGRWASIVWQQVLALESYAGAKRSGVYSGGLYEYLNNPPPGCASFPSSRYSPTESDGVINNPRMRAARTFPVPSSVSSDERALFTAHTRIAQYGMISPRMYLLDDSGNSGRLFIGYIGRHLPTPGTN